MRSGNCFPVIEATQIYSGTDDIPNVYADSVESGSHILQCVYGLLIWTITTLNSSFAVDSRRLRQCYERSNSNRS